MEFPGFILNPPSAGEIRKPEKQFLQEILKTLQQRRKKYLIYSFIPYDESFRYRVFGSTPRICAAFLF